MRNVKENPRKQEGDVKGIFRPDAEALYDPAEHGEFLSDIEPEKRWRL